MTTVNSRCRPSETVDVICISLTSHLPFAPHTRRLESREGWCGRRDLNPHDFRHWNLNPARLPVPPRPRLSWAGADFGAGPPEARPYNRGFKGWLDQGGRASEAWPKAYCQPSGVLT